MSDDLDRGEDGPVKDSHVPLRVTYDVQANAAYIYFVQDIEPGGVARTLSVDPSDGVMVNLDLDSNGRILGLEVLGARSLLSPNLLSENGSR
jgi:uncharacterized protein YuzE